MSVRLPSNQEPVAQGGSRDKPRRVRPARSRAPRTRLLPQMMADAAELGPDSVAVVMGERSLTYAELDARSSRWARVLIEQGVGPEDVVALALTRSIESVTAVWAVAKTGAAFLPVDPGYPENRVLHMLSDSGAARGITSSDVVDALPDVVSWTVIDDPETVTKIDAMSGRPVEAADRRRALTASNTAYIIYTSGSTGLPKGVVVTHSGLADLCREQVARYQLQSHSRTLHFASPSFDASVLELLLAIGSGSSMIIVPPGVYGGSDLHDVVTTHQVSHAFVTPASLASVDPTGLDSLGVIVVGGEACSADLVSRWAPDRQIFNAYGPTETTIVSNISDPLAIGDPITIGRAIAGMTAYILDARLRQVPLNVAGELYLTGPGLARGYHSRRGLTADRFVANPFGAVGSRLYRTGDLVRWRGTDPAERAVEFIGRNDSQVKIRGFRVELGEIDAVVTRYEDVDFAVTVERTTPAGATVLAAYVKPVAGADIDVDAVQNFAAESLPEHMVPAFIVVIDAIPLTPAGKLDRDALPPIAFEAKRFRAPTTPEQWSVAAAFEETLGIADIGLDDHFFELGGNSLMATAMAARLSATLSARIPVRLVFQFSTVEALASALESLAGQTQRPQLAARTRPERVPLSLAQQRMWFLNQFDTSSAVNNIPLAVRFTGPLNTQALASAVADVMGRHESLRTVYPAHDGIGYQQVRPIDEHLPLSEFEVTPSKLVDELTRFTSAGFDVSAEVPLRIALFHVETEPGADPEYVLALAIHHISGDGSSMAPLARDVMAAYTARVAGESPSWTPLPVQYADFTLWQHELLGSADNPTSVVSAQLAFWKDTLEGIPEQLELPADRPRPAVASGRGETRYFGIDSELQDRLMALAASQGATVFMVIHAIFAVTMSRLSSTPDIVIGAPVGGRGDEALNDVIGMFVNTLPMRTRVVPGEPFGEFLDRVRTDDLAAFDHTEVPFERLVEMIDPPRSQGRHPLFQVALFFQNFDQPTFEIGGLSISGVDAGVTFAKFDLQFNVSELVSEETRSGGFAVEMLYATDLFDESTVVRMGEMFVRVARAVVADPVVPIGDIDVLTQTNRATLLHDWIGSEHPVDAEELLYQFEAQIAANPHAPALTYGDKSLTYAQFGARVHRLARYLVDAGVGPEVLVGLAIRRSFDLLVSMYAVVSAGGGFVPLDPDQPAERNNYILDTAKPVMVLTTSTDRFRSEAGPAVVDVDLLDLSDYADDSIRPDERNSVITARTVAYVIFTSGSTGRPKGVAVEHGAIVNQMAWMRTHYALVGSDVYLQKTATTFDVSLWGFFLPLQVGARVVVATPDGHRDPQYLSDVISEQGVTLTDFVPSMLSVFAGQARSEDLRSLRDIFVIGEALPRSTVDAFGAVSPAGVHNLYGPTEAAVSVTFADVTAQNSAHSSGAVPVGVPEWNCSVLVLDSRLHPVPIGSPGELYLAGDQLARGYVGKPDLTAASFVAHPYGGAGSLMYRTGDVVRWSRTGELEYLGRGDFQVKLRGQRIELGEIEAALGTHPVVRSAAAAVISTGTGDQLVGYVVANAGVQPEPEDLLDSVRRALPAYMVPTVVLVLDSLPVNSSGKLDRKALPTPTFQVKEYVPPSSASEESVARVFSDVLGVGRVGRDDDFFALGGNSLLAIRAVSRVNAAFDSRISVREFFDATTVSQLSDMIDSLPASSTPTTPLSAVPRPEYVPLAPSQHRIWYANSVDRNGDWNIPLAFRIDGTLNMEVLRSAVRDIVDRHESLRSIHPATPQGPAQVVMATDDAQPTIERVSVDGDALETALTGYLFAGYDITTETPLRMRLFAVDSRTSVLAVVLHHIAGDALSIPLLVRDLVGAYVARIGGSAPQWEPLPVQFADFTLWKWARLGDADNPKSPLHSQLKYWTDTMANPPRRLQFPDTREQRAPHSSLGESTPIEISAGAHRALLDLAHAQDVSLFMVLAALTAHFLNRYSVDSSLVLATAVANRGDEQLENLVGNFSEDVCMRFDFAPGDTIIDSISQSRTLTLDALSRADVSGVMLQRALVGDSEARYNDADHNTVGVDPLFQAMMILRAATDAESDGVLIDTPELKVSTQQVQSRVSLHELEFGLNESYDRSGNPAGIVGILLYRTDLFDSVAARAIADDFEAWVDRSAFDS